MEEKRYGLGKNALCSIYVVAFEGVFRLTLASCLFLCFYELQKICIAWLDPFLFSVWDLNAPSTLDLRCSCDLHIHFRMAMDKRATKTRQAGRGVNLFVCPCGSAQQTCVVQHGNQTENGQSAIGFRAKSKLAEVRIRKDGAAGLD
jgi:hypothetical protein